MSYLGTPPQSGFITTAKQRVTSSTNNYVDLDHAISSLADVIVWVNSVKQDSTNLSLTTSTRITLGGTLVSSDIVEIAYLGKAVNTQTPATGTVTNDMLAGSIANSKLANSSITLNGSAVSLGGSATVGGNNTPAFYVNKSQNQDIAGDQDVQLTWEDEVLDTDNAFASNTFTPQSAGYYFIYAQARFNSNSDADQWRMALWKNGSQHLIGSTVTRTQQTAQVSGLVHFNGSSDNVKFYVYHNLAGNTMTMQNQDEYTYAFGYKLIGVS
tara:strand:+ start:100 stop:906 length:807 start_codon:yes stop_codon:yes gene_type:complete